MFSAQKLLVFLFFLLIVLNPVSGSDVTDSEKNLFERTLVSDINTADYYELAAWARYLGLEERGTRKELQTRLFNYYQTIPPEETDTADKNILVIESAERSEYFTIEKIGEKYIIISGNVLLQMEDRENRINHIISTDKIIINQDKNLITAFGNVDYKRVSETGEEVFRGEKLSFDISSWEGVFIEGISEKARTVEEREMTFYYSGNRIYRSENDIIIIENAEITSSDPDDPYYKFRARKIWVLAPGEWGVKNAVLYVGNIPVFYFPFFFNPGDKVVFNPAYGIKIPEGYFLQTTTYLKGESSGKGGFSFLALTEDDAEYETKRNGIFLRKTDKITGTKSDDFVKIMFDVYSRLGFFAGVDAFFEEKGYFTETNLYAGAAKSRNIYIDPTGFYSPFYENSEGEFLSTWNRANFLSYNLPVRFGFELNSGLEFKNVKSDLFFELYSDPFFLRDFDNRSEKTDWSRLIGLESDEESDFSSIGLRDRLWWYVHNSYRSTGSIAGNYVREINLLKFDASLNWNSKIQPISAFAELDPDNKDFIPFTARTDYFFPEQYFYFPEYYILPDISVIIRGDLFSQTLTSFKKNNIYSETDRDENTGDLLPPWDDKRIIINEKNTQNEVSDKQEILTFKKMDNQRIKTYKKRDLFHHSLSYTFSPNFSITSTLDHKEWEDPDEVAFEKEYSVLRTYGNLNLAYKAQYYEDFLIFNNNSIFIGDYKNHYDRSDNVTDTAWNSYKNQDYRSSFYRVENKSLLVSYLFYKYDLLDTSFLRYQADIIVLKKEYDFTDQNNNPVYRDSYFSFEDKYFTRHEADFNLKYLSAWNQIQHFRIRTVLPPLLRVIENENIIKTGPLTSTLFLRAREIEENKWEPDNIVWKEKLEYTRYTFIEEILEYDTRKERWDTLETIGRISFFEDDLYYRQSYKYNFPESVPLESVSLLNLWYFEFMYKYEYIRPWEYDPAYGWMEMENEKFIPSEFTAKIDFSKYFMPVWRNRVRYRSRISSIWKMDLQKVTENSFILNIGFDLQIHQFLDFTFNSVSENNRTYRYIPAYASRMGEPWVNPVEDLVNSFNFFDDGRSRYESFFKLKSLDFKAVHHLKDWDLTVKYSGSPDIMYPASGVPEWKWNSELTIMMQWNPIPEIKSVINVVDDNYSF